MYLEGQKKAEIGRIQIDIKGKSYRLRFTYPEKNRHELTISRVSTEGWTTAIRAAQLINRDIDLGDFDDSYARYSPRHAKKIEIAAKKASKKYSLLELWEQYKKLNKERIAKTTQKSLWRDCDRYLSKIPKTIDPIKQPEEFIQWLQKDYASSTIATLFRSCLSPALHLAVRKKQLSEYPFKDVKIPKGQKKDAEAFEPEEIRAIIEAFNSNEFNPKSSRYEHSHYARLVEFLALTGCRPEEAHALIWDDIKLKGGRTYIRFNKAYSKGILLDHTKTHEIRLFPCNDQLKRLIESIPRKKTKDNLIFPSVEGSYICQNDFRRRSWKTVINGLVQQGKVAQYLKPYCLRHSFITRLIREGVDIKTVAALSGNSPEIILSNYFASKKGFILPEL
jgi:integrase